MRFVEGSSIDLVPGGNQNAVRAQNPDAYIDVSQYRYPLTNCVRDARTDLGLPAGQPCNPNLLPGGQVASTGAFLGNLGRNTLISPGIATFDFTLMKQRPVTALGESAAVQFRWELFNLFNRPNFGDPGLSIFDRSGLLQGDAGRIETTRTNARQMQFAVRFEF